MSDKKSKTKKTEKEVVRHAIEYSRGFYDALEWIKDLFEIKKDNLPPEKITEFYKKISTNKKLIEDYRVRLLNILEREKPKTSRRKRNNGTSSRKGSGKSGSRNANRGRRN